ncbi:putative transcription factor bHLH041 isoform X2 [Zingiber officinale]|uniref:putative transcription factor bHLH041 isoform X2 n=1 Tax=Zingiber officinale TaxID=94328 RepID=UPI001C4CF9F0|nr:putative transcription factor bHLH041 isoform X2 [Zingiber officinale]
MDYVFLLDSDDRRRFLQLAGRVLGCSYICTWCPAANQLISMEGWHHEEDNNVPGSSSGIMSLRLFDAYRRSICSILRGCIPGLTFSSGFNYLEIKDADVMSLAALNEQRQFYQKAGIKTIMFLGSGKGEVELGMATPPNATNMEMSIHQVFSKNFIQQSQLREGSLIQLTPNPDTSHLSSSSSSLRSRSLSIGSPESLVFQDPTSRYCGNEAVTRAMLAVICKASPSSPPPKLLYHQLLQQQQQQQQQQHQQQHQGYRSKSGFMVYDRNLAQELEKSVSNKLGGGQKMIKAGIEILRRVSAMRMEAQLQEQSRPTNNQLHHMISERKRREKLNEYFHALRLLLPPGSKKDKASVLANTKNYLTSLKAQIKELEERNQMLEPMRQLIEEGIGESKEKVEVRIIRTAESAPEGSQFINFKLVIIVREQCEMMNLVVHLLECLKERGITNLVAMETSTASQAGAIFARINVGLQVKASDWDEESFTEAAKGAVNDVLHVDDNKGDDDRSLNIL